MIVDAGTRERLLRRLGLADTPTADATGLRGVHRAFVSQIPYENIAVQLGESDELDPAALVQRLLHGGRGGYCFEMNTVLHALLTTLGFAVERRQAIVGPRDSQARGEPVNHMALVVHTPDDGPFIADAGWGEGPLDPLSLAEGAVTSGVFERTIERDGDGWWLSQHKFGSTPGFRLDDSPASLADFAPHHLRLSASPDSAFVRGLIVQRPFDDRIVTLRSRTLFVDGPRVYERRVLADRAELAAVLEGQFGIDAAALGPDRLERLWQKAAQQHDEHRRRPTWLYAGVRAWRKRWRSLRGRSPHRQAR